LDGDRRDAARAVALDDIEAPQLLEPEVVDGELEALTGGGLPADLGQEVAAARVGDVSLHVVDRDRPASAVELQPAPLVAHRAQHVYVPEPLAGQVVRAPAEPVALEAVVAGGAEGGALLQRPRSRR